jgi:predicted RNA-binding protein with EMAP domain
MGRLIDVSELHNKVMLNKSDWGIFATPIDNLIADIVSQVNTAAAISKADYEERLKADLVAILTEIQTEINEVPTSYMTNSGMCIRKEMKEYTSDVNKVIKKVIDSLMEESEVEE